MPATPAISRTTKSASNGTFNIGSLPAGSYIVCIQSNGLAGSHLDPCEWSNNPDTFTIAPGQSAFLRQALIKQASTLQIRINDPSQFLAPRSVHEEPPEVTMELLTPSGKKVHPVLSSTDRTGRTYELRVAFDTPLHLSVSGKHVALNDDRGAAVQAAGSLLSFQHTTADPNPKSFTFTVSSRSK